MYTLQGKQLTAAFCEKTGQLVSIRLNQQSLEFVGNAENTSYPAILEKNQWMGDWLFRVWNGERFQKELTSCSTDIRIVEVNKDHVIVRYESPSSRKDGLRSLSLVQHFWLEDDALCWKAEIQNLTDKHLEVGEAALAFITNTDFAGIFRDPALAQLPDWHGEKQRRFHEERVFQHLFIGGRSSYALLQRPLGDWPALLFVPTGDTFLEAAYQMDKRVGSQFSVVFEGPYYLCCYANGAMRSEGWNALTEATRTCPCGNHSLMLAPGQRHTFNFRFSAIESFQMMADVRTAQGQVTIEAKPGMVAPLGQPIQFSLRAKGPVQLIPNANLKLEKAGQKGDRLLYRLTADQTGQKEIVIKHPSGTSHLFFLFTEQPEQLLKRRAAFISQFQLYDNPADPWNRHHLFMPYDDSLSTLFLDSLETWQVSGTDELCLPTAMFLAEKNIIYPDLQEVEVLERFVEDGLFGKLQSRATYLTIRSMRWVPEEDIYPSDKVYGGKGSESWARRTDRCFQYALISDIYCAMYRLGKMGLTSIRDAKTYLEMMYRTALNWFNDEVGDNKWNGGPSGSTIVDMLEVLKTENEDWFHVLDERVHKAAALNAEASYPYGSELYVDQTSHDQLHAMLTHYGYAEKVREVLTITKALRNGHQPAWYQFGNDKRGNVCCWYGSPMNSRVLYEKYDLDGDVDALRLGYGGLSSFLSTVRRDGAAHGWFLCWPDRFGFDTRSLDTDMGLYNYVRHARGYVVEDEDFGIIGYGCLPARTEHGLEIDVLDGVGRQLFIVPLGLKLEVPCGGLRHIWLDERIHRCVVLFAKGSSARLDDVLLLSDSPWKIELMNMETGGNIQ